MGNKSKFMFSIEKYSIEEIEDSDQMMKVELFVCHNKHNKNGSYFSVENMIRAQGSIYRKPLLYSMNREGRDFEEHMDKLFAAGFVDPLVNDLRYEEKDGRIYLVVSAIVWKVYMPEVVAILERDGVKGISMEVEVTKTEMREDGYVEIIDYNYLGVVLLGDKYETGMWDTTCKMINFSKDDLDKMINESENILKYRLEKNRIKEDEQMAKAVKDKNVQKIDKTDEKTVEKVEEFSEIVENSETEKVDTEVVEVVETEVIEEVIAEPVVEVVTEPIVEEVVEADIVEVETTEPEPELEPEVKEDFSKPDKEIEDLKELVFNLNEKVKDLEKEINDKNTEIESLATFKSEREKELRNEKVSELFNKFSADLSKAEIEEWKEKESKCESFESFEKDISKFMLDKIYHKVNSDEKSTFAKMHIVGGTKEDEPTKEENLWTRLSAKK